MPGERKADFIDIKNPVGLSDTSVCIIPHHFSSIRNIFGITRTNCVRRAVHLSPAGIPSHGVKVDVTIRINVVCTAATHMARRAKVEFFIGSINYSVETIHMLIVISDDPTVINMK